MEIREELELFRENIKRFIATEVSPYYDKWLDNRYVTALVKKLWRETNNGTLGFALSHRPPAYEPSGNSKLTITDIADRTGYI